MQGWRAQFRSRGAARPAISLALAALAASSLAIWAPAAATGRADQSAPTAGGRDAPTASARLLFCDEFDNLDLWNGTSGVWDTSYYWQRKPNGSTLPNEGEWYLNANFGPTSQVKPWTVADGALTLTASRTPAAIAAYAEGHAFVSGMLNSGHGLHQLYGYFELRAKLPRGQGLWPAFWLAPADGSASHEIDVMEVLGQQPRALHTTLHTFVGGHVAQTHVAQVADMTDGFHLYGVDWQSDRITWYFDRRPVFRADTPPGLHKPVFMILDLAVGGPMPGPADATTPSPARFVVDYIRIYSAPPTDAPQAAVAADAPCRSRRGDG